ncbi:efflux RND transporter periplasmic adaptor subunit [Haloferula chungangensis]|uniref:Efflux RND transporter periplasmic adaptor subunit n=1 Tax=Haloferula chungangensis TaxID=1048331 RepID=A0ABW2L4N3_9BACT
MKAKFLGLIIVLAGATVAWLLLRTAPVAETKEKVRSAKVVQVINVTPNNYPVTLSAYGTVIPARRLIVRPEVTGRIESHHPSLVPGGRIKAGETLFKIDPSDYQIALRESKTALEEAQASIDLEAGRQTVAQREYEQLLIDLPDADINKALVLREPFKRQADALLDRSTAQLAKAELNLSRTTVPAPFNALVIEESIETGQLADSGTPLATLVGDDAFWVRTSIPLSELTAIKLPSSDQPGASAKVRVASSSGDDTSHDGKVVRLLGDLEEGGRLARVLVEVATPLDNNKAQPLLLGSYVRVDIDAGNIDNALEIPRYALREGDRLWIVDSNNQLVVREPKILWRNEDTVLTSDVLEDGESLIVSDLLSPLPGMDLAPQPSTTTPDH